MAATWDEKDVEAWVKKAHDTLRKLLHPDVCAKLQLGADAEAEATDAFQRLQTAHETLSDSRKRQIYDLELAGQEEAAQREEQARRAEEEKQRAAEEKARREEEEAQARKEEEERTRKRREEYAADKARRKKERKTRW